MITTINVNSCFVIFFFHQKLFPELTLTATLAQYTDRDRAWTSSGALENRDTLLEILSDAMVLAPLVQLADIQSEVNENTYFYVFTHRSTFSEYEVVSFNDNDEVGNARQHHSDYSFTCVPIL